MNSTKPEDLTESQVVIILGVICASSGLILTCLGAPYAWITVLVGLAFLVGGLCSDMDSDNNDN